MGVETWVWIASGVVLVGILIVDLDGHRAAPA
jgi:hypothetical protein